MSSHPDRTRRTKRRFSDQHDRQDRRVDPADIAQLERMVLALLRTPPANAELLKQSYTKIRTLIGKIEGDSGRLSVGPDVRLDFDKSFDRIKRTYAPLSSDFLKEVGSSLLATEYRFFIGGLEIYLEQIRKTA